jgi:hypothetical protein
MTEPTLRVISLGAGVQSSTMALMAAHGELGPMPDCAIFADTQWEPAHVYTWLDFLKSKLPFPVHIATAGSIRDNILTATATATATGRFVALPFYTEEGGIGRRQCTREFKLEPLMRKQRELLGVQKGERVPKGTKVEVWIGISTDEASRMKPSWKKWQENRWPLIEAGMSRNDCLAWMEKNGYSKPPKSACIGCPYHDDKLWRDMRDNDPDSWADAVEIDRAIRNQGPLRGMRTLQYMHGSLKPLDQVEFSADSQLNLFENECEGMCGV